MNIVLIVIDALRAKNLSCYGYPKLTSPNIDNLAREGVLFEEAYCCTNATDPSLTTIFSGKYPQSHGVVNHGEKISKKELEKVWGTSLLPEILKLYKFVTLAVDWLGRWHKRGYYFYGDSIPTLTDIVKDEFKRLQSVKVISTALKLFKTGKVRERLKEKKEFKTPDAKTITDTALKLLRKNKKRKFFLFIHYFDTHTPYYSPKVYVEKFYKQRSRGKSLEEILDQIDNEKWKAYLAKCVKNAPDADYVVAQYNGSITFVDVQIGRLLRTLHDLRILNNTFVIITSDHGESLLEHGIYFDHHGLYDVTIHVPLIFYFPKLFKGKRITAFVQHVDVVPTILDLLGINAESLSLDGKSLLPLIYGKVKEIRSSIYAEESYTQRKIAIRTRHYKYIQAQSKEEATCSYCERIHGGVRELYDLKEDSEEDHNIANENPQIVNEFKGLLNKWIRSFRPFTEKDRIRARIKKLKYTSKI